MISVSFELLHGAVGLLAESLWAAWRKRLCIIS